MSSSATIVKTRKLRPLSDPDARYKGFHPGESTTLKAGYRYQRGALPLTCDIIREKDVALTLRDGSVIYADIFRPTGVDLVPAIVNWAPYGKGDTGYWTLENGAMFPNRFGIPKNRLSGLQAWEGNDPAYWCAHGYAIVQVDARGAFNSEGTVQYLNSAEGRDGHDAVEDIAALPWCNGRVGLAGNSWLAMSQWRTASEQPPHLAAIAPWEGLTDLYRDVISRGGITRSGFPGFIRDHMYGVSDVEDPEAMLADHPLVDDYWEDKNPDLSKINVPTYAVGSYANPVHVPGTVRNWAALTAPKWLRIHNSQEWPDFYDPDSVADLRKFFDRYLLGLDNDWESTPVVRMAVLDPGHIDTVNRPEDAFPPARIVPKDLFLDRAGHLLEDAAVDDAQRAYQLDDRRPELAFSYRHPRDIEVIGCPTVTLWVEVEGHDDANLYVHLEKWVGGKQRWHQAVDLGIPGARKWMPLAHRRGLAMVAPAFYSGADGMLRVSRRGMKLDAVPGHPELELRTEDKLSPGEIVEVTIPMWPTAMRWHAGEELRLVISSKSHLAPFLPGVVEPTEQPGRKHIFHFGAAHPSRLTLPITPV